MLGALDEVGAMAEIIFRACIIILGLFPIAIAALALFV